MKPYTHTLSSEDAETGSVLIEKSHWADFPEPMREFAIEVGGRAYPTRVVAEDCSCRGAPHQHYHLEAGHFRDALDFTRGARILISREGERYTIANG